MLKVAIVTGSTRPGRKNEAVARWVYGVAKERTDVELEFVDIADYHLPLLDEPTPVQHTQEHTKTWAAKIESFDAYVFVTPEYNHSITGALKNAIDYLYPEWHNKVAAFVSYGGAAGGTRAVEHLRLVMAELQVATVRNQVALSGYTDFENFATFKPEPRRAAEVHKMLDQLIVWGRALQTVRVRPGVEAA
jgi:NAD(P)H-dependent FMN reductase